MSVDKSPQVVVVDDLHPEDNAMLQALYSRSPAGVNSHLEKVRAADTGKFMSRYYVGYGHASIGDCGVTSVFVENYSMLACKAIQDSALYSGQEASTRYLDFSQQPMIDPYNHPESKAILGGWMALYNTWLPKVAQALKVKYPFNADEYKSEKSWENAIQVRAFDTMRSYLPVGTSTLFSWTTNLRQGRDKLMRLKKHPLPEVRDMAKDIYAELTKRYTHSFSGDEMMDGTDRYGPRDNYYQLEAVSDNYESVSQIKERYQLGDNDVAKLLAGQLIVRDKLIDKDGLMRCEEQALNSRPKGALLSRRLAAYGHYQVLCAIDFGSYRDLQRHRNGIAPLPLIEPTYGMFSWYTQELESLLGADYKELEAATQSLFERVTQLPTKGVETDALRNQYLLPMGTTVICSLAYSLPQMVYVGELRSGATVHPSLRPIAQDMLKCVANDFPKMPLYGDMSKDSWSEKRGEQTITEKSA